MKLFIYSHLDKNGKSRYQKLEISDSEAEEWVQIDFERRKKNDPDAVIRTAQEIQNSIDREFVNSDRREYAHRAYLNAMRNENGTETDYIETLSSEEPSALERLIEEKEADAFISLLEENLNAKYADVLIKIVIGGQSIEQYAEENELNIKAVYNLLCRAKEAVKKKYSKIFKQSE